MKKNELVRAIAEKTGLTLKDVEALLTAQAEVVEEWAETSEIKDKLVVPGVVTLSIGETKARAERTMKSGLTGKEIVISAKPAGKKVVVKAVKSLKNIVK